MIEPKAIMGIVVSLMLLAVGAFAFFIVVGEVDEHLPGARIENVLNTENFNSQTFGTLPNTTWMDYNNYSWYGGTAPGINGTGTALNFRAVHEQGTYNNYSRWNISTNEIGYPNRIKFDATQGTGNNYTVINVTNSAGATYANIVMNKSYVAVDIGGTVRINRSITFGFKGLNDTFTFEVIISMTNNVTSKVRVVMSNASAGILNDTGLITPSNLGSPGKIIVSGRNVGANSVQRMNITIDNISVKAFVWPTITVTDTGTIGNSVFSILGIVLIMGAIMAIIGVVYKFKQ